jgi:hypothetical protein
MHSIHDIDIDICNDCLYFVKINIIFCCKFQETRYLLSRDALEIRRSLFTDRPEVSVAEAVCVTKPKKQQRKC